MTPTADLGSISSSRCQITRSRRAVAQTGANWFCFWTRYRRSHVASRGAALPQAGFARPLAADVTPTWWSQTGSNRRPPACKAGALPTELWPPPVRRRRSVSANLVGLGRFELPTSRLSSARSNQLSYKPKEKVLRTGHPPSRRPRPHLQSLQTRTATRRRRGGTGSSKKKEKRRRRRPAYGHDRSKPACPMCPKRSDRTRGCGFIRDHP